MGIRLALFPLLLAIGTISGCSKTTTAPVSGKVRYQGNILLSGSVAFQAEDGRVASSNIQEDGSYSIPEAPLGNVKITVQTFPPSPQLVPPDKIDSTPVEVHKYIKIPEHFADFEKSGKTYTVKPGKQAHDIDLP